MGGLEEANRADEVSFRIEFLSGAVGDLVGIHREISDFSEAQAEAFSRRLDRRLTQLARFPEMGPPFTERFRRLVLGSFLTRSSTRYQETEFLSTAFSICKFTRS